MDLLEASHAYTEQHFSEIVHGEEFLNLPAMQICELISSDQLTVPSEEKVLNISCKNYSTLEYCVVIKRGYKPWL